MSRRNLLTLCLIAIMASLAHAQDTSLIAAARKTTWTTAGATIATRATVCATVSAYTGTAATINTAIQNCTAGQVVQLGSGTFTLSTPITFAGKSSVTLRGNGPDATFLVVNGSSGLDCGATAHIYVNNTNCVYQGSPQNVANWSAGYTQGATVVTLSATTNLQVGTQLFLDQCDDGLSGNASLGSPGCGTGSVSDPGSIFVCQTVNVCANDTGSGAGRTNRGQLQVVTVTAINGSNVTISPGLTMPNWRSGQSPGVWYAAVLPITGVGVENLSLDNAGDASSGIMFFNATQSWVKNVRSMKANRSHVWMEQADHITTRDSYLFDTYNSSSQSYGVECYQASHDLVENNIFQHVAAPLMMNGGCTGDVYAYNYAINDYYAQSATWMAPMAILHGIGDMLLYEGNDGAGFQGDNVHGTHHFVTVFRNYFAGWETTKTQQTIPVHLYSGSRYFNVLGNVLGRSTYHDTYECAPASSSTSACASNKGDTAIWTVGWSGNEGAKLAALNNDTLVKSTLYRWGNYDTVSATVTCSSGEVPTGDANYPNSLPGDCTTFGTSFYLSVRPNAWWKVNSITPAWPPIGPDVTGGGLSNVGGHANRVPARICFEDIMGGAFSDAAAKTFNAATCYTAASDSPTITTSGSLPSVTVNVAYATTISGTCTNTPCVWTSDIANTGACTGVTFTSTNSTTATMGGTPTTAGVCSFNATMTDASMLTDTDAFTITVNVVGTGKSLTIMRLRTP